jgi:hypothetical protein
MLAWFTIALLPYYSQLFAKIMSWFPHRTRPVFHHQRGPALGTWHTCSKQFLFHSALSWTSSNFQSVSNIFKQFTIFYHLLPSFTIFYHLSSYLSHFFTISLVSCSVLDLANAPAYRSLHVAGLAEARASTVWFFISFYGVWSSIPQQGSEHNGYIGLYNPSLPGSLVTFPIGNYIYII